MRKNSIKNTRINGEVLRELSNIIRGEIKDPRMIFDNSRSTSPLIRVFLILFFLNF